jgi:hypothetical protein
VTDAFDFLAACRSSIVLRARDRDEATIGRVSSEEGLIYGDVHMFGPSAWWRDGLYRDAPAGAAGPLDLMPPRDAGAGPRKAVCLADALDPANRPFCCD